MTDFKRFCERYDLDPSSQEARDQYAEARENLAALHSAAAWAATSEAIEKAKQTEE